MDRRACGTVRQGAASPEARETGGFHAPHVIEGWKFPRPGLFRIFMAAVGQEDPMLASEDDVLAAAERWRREGRGVALATVVETWGSAPRPVGSHLVIDDRDNFLGSVSGGCVEGAVVGEAAEVIKSGLPKILEFGVADETAWKVGLSCGGKIRVLVEKVD
jgi:hypothetical protein